MDAHEEMQPMIADESGFTLVELLIVIVILGILTAVVVFSIGGLRSSGNQAACKATVKQVQQALDSYRAQQGLYPSTSGTFATSNVTTGAGYTTSTVLNADTAVSAAQAEGMISHLLADIPQNDAVTGGPAEATRSIKFLQDPPIVGAEASLLARTTAAAQWDATSAATAVPSGARNRPWVTISYYKADTAVNPTGDTSERVLVRGWYRDGSTAVKGCNSSAGV